MHFLSLKPFDPYVRVATYTAYVTSVWAKLCVKWLKLTQNIIILNVYKQNG